jgi:pyridoxine kinase
MGDAVPGVYVRPGIVELMRDHALPAADVITPNQFELDLLSGRTSTTVAEALAAVETLRAKGPRAVLVTSLHTEDTPADSIDLLACDADGAFRVRTPRLPVAVNGAGDAIAALFFAHYLRTGVAAEAASRAASSVFGILSRTAQANARELLLIEAQDELVTPSKTFLAEPM